MSANFFDLATFTEIWNEGRPQQLILIRLTFGWLNSALEIPIEPLTWRRALFVLNNVPIDDNGYGDATRGVKLATGEGAKQFAAITDGALVTLAA